jgi:hypothetical protein
MVKLMIQNYEFGSIIIDGKKYTSDLIIYPDGHVEDSWWRKSSHNLFLNDIRALVDTAPEVIIAGTGINGLMKVAPDLEKSLAQKEIKLLYASNLGAIKTYNDLASSTSKVGACFHLTC